MCPSQADTKKTRGLHLHVACVHPAVGDGFIPQRSKSTGLRLAVERNGLVRALRSRGIEGGCVGVSPYWACQARCNAYLPNSSVVERAHKKYTKNA